MGRVSRYKKIKSCDPFAKRLQKVEKVDTIHDQPPDEFHEKRGLKIFCYYYHQISCLVVSYNCFYVNLPYAALI